MKFKRMIDLKKITCGFGITIAMALATTINPAAASYPGNIEVTFSGLKNSQGKVCVNLFNGQKGFPDGGKDSNLKSARCIPIIKGIAKIAFENLPSGNYAISSIHDLNGDTVLNSNFLGIPSEGVGFSNNPIVKTSAPSFNQARFFVSSKTEISIKMQYFN